jgi:hypothetical protein
MATLFAKFSSFHLDDTNSGTGAKFDDWIGG